jgi:hypothetical protein
LARGDLRAKVAPMDDFKQLAGRRTQAYGRPRHTIFYGLFLPLGVLANLGLGILLMAQLHPDGWAAWLLAATAAFCCFVAGWLAAAAWSQSYWNNAMAQQVAVWRRIADAFFGWLEDAPLPAEALSGLRQTLDEAVPSRDAK